MHPLINIATTAALNASKLITRSFEKVEDLRVHEKKKNDFVSEVDIRAEAIIIDTIRKMHPTHGIIAEESGEDNAEQDTVWIIDPLDGTRNYLHGLPHFAVSIAVKENNKITHGVIYDPMRQELFAASNGAGARLNNRRLRITPVKSLETALLATGFPFRDKNLFPQYLQTFEPLFQACSGIRRAGSAALDLAYVAAGRLDGYWEFSLKPWDIAAGALMIKEAGGLVGDFQGGETYLESGNILAANPKLFKIMLQTIQPAFSER